MNILISDIPPHGVAISATAASDKWLKHVMLEALADGFAEDDVASLSISCSRIEHNVDIIGELRYSCHPVCDRCLQEYQQQTVLQLKFHLAPLYESDQQRCEEEGEEVVLDDEEFSYYEGDRIELDAIVREQLLLDQPMKYLCKEECPGLCQRCGANLNDGPCECVGKA